MLLNKLEISDYIRPVGIKDTYPTHLDIFGKGGCHSVKTIQDRDAITTPRRSEGMYCYVIDTLETYILLGGTKNSNWYKVFGKTDDISFNMHAKRDYVLLGDANEKVSSSSLLIDLKNSFIEHLRNSSRLTKGHIRLGNDNNQAIETKRIDFDNLPYLNKDYIFLGGNDSQTQSSSLLIDLKNSFIEHVRDSKKLTKGHLWLGNYNNQAIETSSISFNNLPQINKDYILLGSTDYQVVSSNLLINLKNSFIEYTRDNARLKNGYLWLGNYNGKAVERKNIGLDNLPLLGAATLPVPDVSIIPGIPSDLADLFKSVTGYAYLPNPTQPFNPTDIASNFSPSNMLSWVMGGAWLPEIFTGNSGKLDPTSQKTGASSSLALTSVSLARAHKLFDNSSFIVSSKGVKFNWENQIAEKFANDHRTRVIAKLYGYQNTYDYGDNAQALDELDRGILWNSGKRLNTDPIDYKSGVLRKAISGADYVNTTDIPVGPLVILDPSYPLPGHKLIAPTKFNIRKGVESEFGKVKDPQSQQIPEFNVLDGEYAKFKNIGLPASEFSGGLLKVNDKGELAKAEPDIDYPLITTVSNILNTVSILDKWLMTVTGINKIAGAVGAATKVTDIIKTVGDVTNTSVNAFAKTSSIVSTATEVATTASLQAQLTTLTALVSANKLEDITEKTALFGTTILTSALNAVYTTAVGAIVDKSSRNYADSKFSKLRPLLSENTFSQTDDYDLYGRGNIWYDCDNSVKNDDHRCGLRLTAWDSSWFSMTENDLVPTSMGIFGYKWAYINNPKLQQGFVWEAEYENSSSSNNYRFPKKFSLRDVGHSYSASGWNIKDNELMNYDLYQDKFNFKKVAKFDKNVILTGKIYESLELDRLAQGTLFLHRIKTKEV